MQVKAYTPNNNRRLYKVLCILICRILDRTWKIKNLKFVLGSVCYILLGKPLSLGLCLSFFTFRMDLMILSAINFIFFFCFRKGGIHKILRNNVFSRTFEWGAKWIKNVDHETVVSLNHTIRKSDIPALPDSWFTKTASIEMPFTQKLLVLVIS